MRLPAVIVFCVVCTTSLAFAELPKPTGDAIVPAGATLEFLFKRKAPIQGGLTEGPTVAPDGSIYFSDIPFGEDKGLIMRFDPRTKQTTVFAEDSHKSNGLAFDAKGHLVACEGADGGGRCLSRWNIATKQRTVIADKYMGKKFNAPNDLCIDNKGRIYFSDPKYLGAEERELEYRSIYRVDETAAGARVIEVTHDIEKPNGVALSLDEKTLFAADTNNGTDRIDTNAAVPPKQGAMKVHAFPLGSDGLVNGPRKTIVDFGDQAGCDGMTIDSQGHVYLACRSVKRPGVMVIDATGKELAFIPTGESQPGVKEPVGLPSNVTFGSGAESKTLYITVDKSLFRIALKVAGAEKR